MKRIKTYWQMESTDCGPACLQMICAYYGRSVSLQYIKDGMSISRIGVTVRDISDSAERLGIGAVVATAELSKLEKIKDPVIIHWNNNHFVLLYRVRKNSKNELVYYVADPSNGKMKFSQEEFSLNWLMGKQCGLVIFLKPTETFYEFVFPKDKKDFSIVFSLFKKYIPSRKQISLSLILLILSMFCSWVIPYLYQIIIDDGVSAGNISLVWKLFLVQLAFFIGYTMSSSFSSFLLSRVNLNVGIEYVSELLYKIMKLPMKCFETKLNTEFIQRLDDFNRIRTFLTDNLISIIYYLINAIVYFILLSYYSWEAVIIFAIMSLIVSTWEMYFLRERKFLDYSLFIENAKSRNQLYEIINNMPDIKINNAQKPEMKKWENKQEHINSLVLRQMVINFKQNAGRNTVNRLRDIVIICYCCIIAITGDLTVGVLMSISYILGQLGGPVGQIQSFVTQYQMFRVSLSRLAEVQRKKDEFYGSENQKLCNLNNKIELAGVCFKYEGSFCPNIFENLSVAFPANKVTAIVGNSGSGKSTLVKLLLGFYLPQKGKIKIDGKDLSAININSLRNLCGVVLQDGKIFSGTIAENIALGVENIDLQRIEEVAKLACIDEFVNRQPGKYSMLIGPSGLELSQGQKQRILIARAIYKNPQLLIFDEATSSLDTVNERRIMDNLNEFFKNRTVIVVAHRLSTVVRADNIIFLDNGKIAEQGTHKELVAKRGKYFELIKNQLELEQ